MTKGGESMQNILVGFIAVVTVGAGIWAWWMENGKNGKSPEENPDKED
jgi:hypothetical protein